MIYMDARLWLQSSIRGNKYVLLYLPNDLSDLHLEDIEYIEAVLALQMKTVRLFIERSVAARWPFPEPRDHESRS